MPRHVVVLLLAVLCARPVAGQMASSQGGMYYGPFRGPLYGQGAIGVVDPFLGVARSVAVVPTVSFGGTPRVFPTGPAGGIVGPYGRPAPAVVGASRTVVGGSRTVVGGRGPGAKPGVNRPRGRGLLLEVATIV